MTLRPRLNRVCGRVDMQQEGRTEGMKDSHTEMEVNRKAAEESELVSRQRNARGEVGGARRRERSKSHRDE